MLRAIRLAPKIALVASTEPPALHVLANGVPLPIIGFGAGATAREESERAVRRALVAGYRLIDGATAYGNEDVIGDVLLDATTGGREGVSLTSKVWYTELGFDLSLEAAARSLADYRTDYHDLLVIHWPTCHAGVEWMRCHEVPAGVGTWQESWRALERLYAEGAALAIGVSNFGEGLLVELEALAATQPHVVQNHGDVVWQDLEASRVATDSGMFYQAYSSLRGLLSDDASPHYARARRVLREIGKRYGGKSVAQVALRWEVQHGHGIVPRSHQPAHLTENLRGVLDFELEEEDMAAIDALGIHVQHVDDEL